MVRTQIQLSDRLYAEAKRAAEEREISLTEVVRRGLETFLKMYPPNRSEKKEWKLEPPANTKLLIDPFEDENWRAEANAGR